jgi:hypothetical protein
LGFQELQVLGGTEILAMNYGGSDVVLMADASHDGDVDDCLDGALAYIQDEPVYGDIEPLENAWCERIEGEDDGRAFAAIRYTDVTDGDRLRYADAGCEPSESTVEMSQSMAEDDTEEHFAALEDLLAGLEIGD